MRGLGNIRYTPGYRSVSAARRLVAADNSCTVRQYSLLPKPARYRRLGGVSLRTTCARAGWYSLHLWVWLGIVPWLGKLLFNGQPLASPYGRGAPDGGGEGPLSHGCAVTAPPIGGAKAAQSLLLKEKPWARTYQCDKLPFYWIFIINIEKERFLCTIE